MPLSPNTQRRLPALAVTALLHVAIVFALLHAVFVMPAAPVSHAPHETQITLLPVIAPPPLPGKKRQRAATGSNAITPYFNPDAMPQFLPRAKVLGLHAALSACAPENYDMASEQVRRVCGRIGALLQNDPGHFGVLQDVSDPKHWERELARREAPYLAPCMSPYAPPKSLGMVAINLGTLMCVYDLLMHPYDPEKRARYSQ